MKASIVIPTYNACERLQYNLLALNMQDFYIKEFEVIVVDNGSSDETCEMLSSIDINYNLSTIYINKNKGRAFARNLGVKEAKGDIIVFLDSDMIVEKTFLAKHIKAHEFRNIAVCGQNWNRVYSFYYEDFKGYLKRNLAKQLFEKDILYKNILLNKQPLISVEEIISNECFKASFSLTKMYEAERVILERFGVHLEGYYFPWSVLVTNNCSIEKDKFNEVGGFDNHFIDWGCEDLDLGYRLYKNGCKFNKLNDIRCLHQEHPINFLDNGADNIRYFTKKYDSIDLLLFYYGYLIKVDKNMANEIMKEIQDLQIMKYDEPLELYRRLLVALRNKQFKTSERDNDWFYEIKKLKADIVMEKEELEIMLNTIEMEGAFRYFIDSFKLLIIKVLNNNLENLSM